MMFIIVIIPNLVNSQLLISRFELVVHCQGIPKQTPRLSVFPQDVGIIQVKCRRVLRIQVAEEPQVHDQCYSWSLHGSSGLLEFSGKFLLLRAAQKPLAVSDNMSTV